METWAIVTLVLGASAISSLLTFFITKMQVSHSDTRFEKELERAREADSHQRRWEVRSEPLLKLRAELALMACKYEKLVDAAKKLSRSPDITHEEEEKILAEVINEDTIYMASGNLQQILNIQYDAEIITQVNNIRNTYLWLMEYALNYHSLEKDQLKEFRDISLTIETRIPEVQELIYKRLEQSNS